VRCETTTHSISVTLLRVTLCDTELLRAGVINNFNSPCQYGCCFIVVVDQSMKKSR